MSSTDAIRLFNKPYLIRDRLGDTLLLVENASSGRQLFVASRALKAGETLFVEDCVACVTYFQAERAKEGSVASLYPPPLYPDKIKVDPPDPSLGVDITWSLVHQILERLQNELSTIDHLISQLPEGGSHSLGNVLRQRTALVVAPETPATERAEHQAHRDWLSYAVRKFGQTIPLATITSLYARVNCHFHQLRLPLSGTVHGAAVYVLYSRLCHECNAVATAYGELFGKLRVVCARDIPEHTPITVNKYAQHPFVRSLMTAPESIRTQTFLISGGRCACDECADSLQQFGFLTNPSQALDRITDFWADVDDDTNLRNLLEELDSTEAHALLNLLEAYKHIFFLSRRDAFPNTVLIVQWLDVLFQNLAVRGAIGRCRKIGHFLGLCYTADILLRPTTAHPFKDYVIRELMTKCQPALIEQTHRKLGTSSKNVGRKLIPFYTNMTMADFFANVVAPIATAMGKLPPDETGVIPVDETAVEHLKTLFAEGRVKAWVSAVDLIRVMVALQLADKAELLKGKPTDDTEIRMDEVCTDVINQQVERLVTTELYGNTLFAMTCRIVALMNGEQGLLPERGSDVPVDSAQSGGGGGGL